ncbi:MAG: NAD-dependent epimerase/dehydratase family protein [Deltaproteobacteria bacterium]|nr:NAD-dependent epimerase/dehydratase family protein [Deltaproteobacteria bacterium]
MKKVLVTGSCGFVGKNLLFFLNNIIGDDVEIFEFDVNKFDNPDDKYLEDEFHEFYDEELGAIDFEAQKKSLDKKLENYCKDADFIFHLAGVNRPENVEDFVTGNVNLTGQITDILIKNNLKTPLLLSSSIQALQDNPYGRSKLEAEQVVFDYSSKSGAEVYVYRLTNLFGKWSRPNYNSVIATFCHNMTHGEDITVNDPEIEITLAYIDDVAKEFINAFKGNSLRDGKFCKVEKSYTVKLGKIVELLEQFVESRESLVTPDLADEFTKKLHATFLSYLPPQLFTYPLKMNVDNRGSFTEFIKSSSSGQVSINVSKPGITKGEHYHHTKNEKFMVVSGQGEIRLRSIDSNRIIIYTVKGEELKVVDIPPGYTHNITNTGKTDMVTVMWVNEIYDPENPDTFFLKVDSDE